MGRLRAASIVSALAVAAALGLAACGGSDELLPGKTAEQINMNLDQVRSFVAEGDCAGAESAVAEVSEQVDGLGGVDQKLKAALRQGTSRLGEVVSSCGEEALADEEAEREAEEEEEGAEQEEQAAVEAQEDELTEDREEQKEEKAQDKAEKEAEKEQQASEKAQEQEEAAPPSGKGAETGNGNGPPAETPSGNEPPAGGVGPGAEVE